MKLSSLLSTLVLWFLGFTTQMTNYFSVESLLMVTLRDIGLDQIICSYQLMLLNVLTTTITMKVL
ncbi:hypothetical protein ASD79_23050 [Caulobacter sp. Root655]|nr:hypothetical protein ASD35_17900 [Pelomonas sp. Root1444]KRA61099.1 hypothetical protein ASD79_23050 [Caulobacter sp. Root655]